MPKVFGWQHLVYLAIFIAVSAVAVTLIKLKMKKEQTVDLTVKFMGAALVALVIWNRFAIAEFKDSAVYIIPDSFCGVANLALGICAVFCKRDALPFHYLVYIGIGGGLANVIYPYYISQDANFMLPATISGLLHHSLSFDLCLIMLLTGHFKVNYKKFYAFPLGVCFSICFGVFLLDAFGTATLGEKGFTTAMNIYSPVVPGTFLTWYVVFPAATVIIWAGLYIYEKFVKPKFAKKDAMQTLQAED